MSPPSPGGLSGVEALRRLREEGANRLPDAGVRSPAAIAFGVVREPMFLLLATGSVIYLLVGDVREAAILAVSIVLVMAITVIQERKSERALEALRDLSSPRALVVRDGAPVRVPGAEVVRGDLMLVAEGDRVPADARLEGVNDLLLDESLLTGESLSVSKEAGAAVYSGTLVVKGQGRAVVTATGARTEFGRIGASLASFGTEKTLLERETARVVRAVAAVAIALSALLALYSVATGADILEGVLAGITLAMAILPEEFPVVLTVFLALGAWRISRHGVLTRRMPAIETLGAATVLCVDKTGTLTENRMAVAETYAAAGDARPVLEAAALACELETFDPMERAIVEAAGDEGRRLRAEGRLERDYPFGPDFPAVCHAWRFPDGARRAFIKGAPETVLSLCGLGDAEVAAAMRKVEEASARGLRVLAVAEARCEPASWPDRPADYRFTWLGYVALADPIRAAASAAIARCREAGIRVVMITGDYPGTALAIARQAGISAEGGVLTGAEIAAMEPAALAQAVRQAAVFARVRPEQKLRLVTAYKAAGEVVAMTGDGVNDAPALKAAHIGVAMGLRGTDVAREASALVLTEDDFGAIVQAVALGRRIYENIRNAMRYLLAVHVPIAGMSFLPLAFGWPPFLSPVHVVFLEFVIDPACSVVFEAEAAERDIMRRPPRDPREPLFGAQMVGVSLALGASVLAAVCAACGWAVAQGLPDGEVRALGFASILFGNLAMIHATRSRDRSIVELLARGNAALWWVTGGAAAALAAAIYVPPLAGVFRFSPLSAQGIAVAAVAGFGGVLFYEGYKMLRPRLAANGRPA